MVSLLKIPGTGDIDKKRTDRFRGVSTAMRATINGRWTEVALCFHLGPLATALITPLLSLGRSRNRVLYPFILPIFYYPIPIFEKITNTRLSRKFGKNDESINHMSLII